jgi:hypothetical protein
MNYKNKTVIPYSFSQEIDVLLPIEQTGSDVSIDGTPVMRVPTKQGSRNVKIAHVCSEDGIRQVTEDAGTKGGIREALRQSFQSSRPFGGCVAVDPHRGISRMVLVPPAITESTLVRLYLMNGAGVDYVENVFDNGFVRMWKVTEG